MMSAGLAATAVAAPAAVTFHGTFSSGEAYASAAPGELLFAMPVRGDWNLNVNLNLAPDQGRAQASMIVKYIGGGLHARWVPSELTLRPMTSESDLAAVIPGLEGVVNDPADGVYAYVAHIALLDSTMFVVYDANTSVFFYAAVAGPDYACQATDVPLGCFDSPKVIGTGGR